MHFAILSWSNGKNALMTVHVCLIIVKFLMKVTIKNQIWLTKQQLEEPRLIVVVTILKKPSKI